jgi:RNA polymerase sigma factor (sigma-70 family)
VYKRWDSVEAPEDDQALIDRAIGGDLDAYGQLIERYSDLLFRTACLILRSAADAEDATQETFLKAFPALRRFRSGAALRPWLLQIVANEARNLLRSERRRASRQQHLVESLQLTEVAPSPEEAAEAREGRERLFAAYRTLGEEDRLVIGCRYILELSIEETARALDCREGTVKSRLSRALGRLKQKVGRPDD